MRKNEMYMSFLADSVNESLARITVASICNGVKSYDGGN